jgi:hypothetical protein
LLRCRRRGSVEDSDFMLMPAAKVCAAAG